MMSSSSVVPLACPLSLGCRVWLSGGAGVRVVARSMPGMIGDGKFSRTEKIGNSFSAGQETAGERCE